MPDKKPTDSEIVKALKILEKDTNCGDCAVKKQCKGDCVFTKSLGLINHLQAKAIKEQNKNSKLRNERNRLQAQNKDLADTVHNLTIEKDALFDKVEELKAEIERLKTNLNVELENFATEYDNKIKAEAYKEFAERLKAVYEGFDDKNEVILYSNLLTAIDCLLIGMVGDSNAE